MEAATTRHASFPQHSSREETSNNSPVTRSFTVTSAEDHKGVRQKLSMSSDVHFKGIKHQSAVLVPFTDDGASTTWHEGRQNFPKIQQGKSPETRHMIKSLAGSTGKRKAVHEKEHEFYLQTQEKGSGQNPGARATNRGKRRG